MELRRQEQQTGKKEPKAWIPKQKLGGEWVKTNFPRASLRTTTHREFYTTCDKSKHNQLQFITRTSNQNARIPTEIKTFHILCHLRSLFNHFGFTNKCCLTIQATKRFNQNIKNTQHRSSSQPLILTKICNLDLMVLHRLWAPKLNPTQ